MKNGLPVTLLYIDDDEAFARLVMRNLTRHGYDVTWASNGDEGLGRLNTETYDAVALDHYMPGRGGVEVLADIKQLAEPPPVVYVTGTDEGRVAVNALKAGAVDYVIKEVGDHFFTLLRAAIDQALKTVAIERQKDAAEREMRSARDRAETLLREVNHRVGNSLQLVSTFVHMQANAIDDEAARSALMETQHRIQAVAQVHRRLYTTDDVTNVEMGDYLRGLIDELNHSLAGHGLSHDIELQAETVRVATDKAVSVGVIVNELVTNACKYAYPAGAGGSVRVFLNTLTDGIVSLIVEDDGVGYRPGQQPRGSGLGQKIILAMAQNLRSKVEIDPTHRGTRAKLAFAP